MVLNQVGTIRVRNWEQIFSSWAQGPGNTENQKCENAIRAIKDAIQSSEKLRNRNINVFLQGSYWNRVNVRRDSDVDVGILCFDTFFYDLPNETTKEIFGIIPASYHYAQFKDEVQESLVKKFGSDSVKRGNKAFDIKANLYRVDADVAPFFEHRRYYQNERYESGVQLLPDNGGRVINWPEQHYKNGVSKNDLCSRRYKRAVRILKKLCVEMQENKISEADPIPGFLIECLVWNVPNEYFQIDNYYTVIRNVLVFLFNNTINDEECSNWTEVSRLKYLFHSTQAWNRFDAHKFIGAAWNYIGFE